MRNLVTIRKITSISPIPGAARIETAHIDGWECVVRKDEFKVGEEILYFEVDSVLPKLQPFSFLVDFRALYNGKIGYVIKPRRLRGQISQGLVLPLSVCDVLGIEDPRSVDLASAIGVWKYDPPPPTSMGGDPVGKNPSWFVKTDEERVQNIDPESLFGEWSATEKVDGTSMSVWIENGIVGVGGHNWQFSLHSKNGFVRIAIESGLIDWLKKNVQDGRLCIQGELAGPGIQGNPLQLSSLKLFIFMMQDGTKKYKQGDIDRVYRDMLTGGVDPDKVASVPRLLDVKLEGNAEEVSNLIALSGRMHSVINPERLMEGFVLRSLEDGNRSFKVLSPEYCIKHQS